MNCSAVKQRKSWLCVSRKPAILMPRIALVSSNLRLVVKVAMDFQKYWMQNFMDLIQEGNVGLVQATKKFDPYRGVKFSYYAAYWIRAYILKFIMDNWRLVKIGTTQAQRKLFFSLNKEKKLLESQGFKPEIKLLAERLNVKESEVIEMGQRMDNWDVSLEAPVRSDSEDEQKNFLPHDGPGIEEIVCQPGNARATGRYSCRSQYPAQRKGAGYP